MGVFHSADCYGRFANRVRKANRFFRDNEDNRCLEALLQYVRSDEQQKQILGTDFLLNRAQRGCSNNEQYFELKDGESEFVERIGPYPAERMRPLPDHARENRANPLDIVSLPVERHGNGDVGDSTLEGLKDFTGSLQTSS
jgi:hypothetical protein